VFDRLTYGELRGTGSPEMEAAAKGRQNRRRLAATASEKGNLAACFDVNVMEASTRKIAPAPTAANSVHVFAREGSKP
jgi:hypothetical protein